MSTEYGNIANPLSDCNQYLTYSLGQNGNNTIMYTTNDSTVLPWREHTTQPIQISTLGQFNILSREHNLSVSSKGQHKPIELLKALIALGGVDVGETRLCDALWPDTEGDIAHSAFSVTLHRLRKLIGREALLLNDSRLTLNAKYCWVDVWECERFLNMVIRQFTTHQVDEKLAIQNMESAMFLYNGPFLGNEDEQAWYLMFRERMHSKVLRSMLTMSSYFERHNRCEMAVDIYLKGLELDPLAERFYFRIMKCFATHGRKAEAISVYLRCCKVLETTLGVKPSKNTTDLYKSLLN